jgi:methionine-S-sulfoxide reductase
MKALIIGILILALVGACFDKANAADRASTVKNSNSQKLDRALFGMGCFWKSQFVFSKVPGVVKTTVGYSGGNVPNPTYMQVCTHKTGHVETVLVEFDPNKTTYRKLLEVFWNHHDPTTVDRQGPDVGDNYKSIIFYTSPEQRKEAFLYKDELEKSHQFQAPIVTAIEPAKPFFPAEDYHQNYFVKHGEVCN